ncbi:MAG: GNAT family N-acetyltransferase [Polaromonas sp.]|uniref:GNAT family N-acetyltransferase n=1 Tax=Polaromonas sp. TaxID=1869339 RepID=UPI002733E555|nr:GNAT family N-acetyltransferase [Polaromonas sp.]MDP3249085.1 GNAT family N-acetyltransferase [Polaromonas sp.]
MRAEDIAWVLEIQSCCYDETKLESAQSFLAKLSASPTSCFVALVSDGLAGYLVAIPAEAGSPPPLNSPTYSVPPTPDALYLHDLAVHPAARGASVAVALIEAYFQALKQLKAQFACLTAVNGSTSFWERHGFRVAVPTGSAAGHMETYGEEAQYMNRQGSA